MLGEFAEFVGELFPGVDPETATRRIAALKARQITASELYALPIPPELNQGDIIEPINFVVTDQDGELAEFTDRGMVLSNSCDIDHDPLVLIAACRAFAIYNSHRSVGAILANTFTSLMYLPGVPGLGDLVVDLATIQSMDVSYLRPALAEGAIVRSASLTETGWYLLMAKMTLHLLRPRSPDEVRGDPRPANAFRRGAKRLGSWLLRRA